MCWTDTVVMCKAYNGIRLGYLNCVHKTRVEGKSHKIGINTHSFMERKHQGQQKRLPVDVRHAHDRPPPRCPSGRIHFILYTIYCNSVPLLSLVPLRPLAPVDLSLGEKAGSLNTRT